MDPLEGFTYRGSFSNLQAALEEHQVSAVVGERLQSPHQAKDNTSVKEYGMATIGDYQALTNDTVSQAKNRLGRLDKHIARLDRLQHHYRQQSDEIGKLIFHAGETMGSMVRLDAIEYPEKEQD